MIMNKMKRMLSLILCAALALSLCQMPLMALADPEGGTNEYEPMLTKIDVPTEKIIVLDIQKEKGMHLEWGENPNFRGAEALLTIRTIQGIVNRYSEEKIYLVNNTVAWSNTWNPPSDVNISALTNGMIPDDVEIEYITDLDYENVEFPVLSYLMENYYEDYIEGVVKIHSAHLEYTYPWDVPKTAEFYDSGSIMAALTACAQLDAIPVSEMIEEYLADEGYDFTEAVLEDTTGEEFDDGIYAFNWAYDNYFTADTTRDYIGKFSFNDWGDLGAAISYSPIDYYIATKAFIMDLNAHDSAESAAMATLMNPTNYAPGTPVLGSADGEGVELTRIFSLGYTFSFFDGANLSVHSSFESDPAALKPKTVNVPDTIDPDGAYVAFYVTDGDSWGIAEYLHQHYWENASPEAQEIPIGWSISPMVFDLFPNLMSWRTHNNYDGKYELIANYSDGDAPFTAEGLASYIERYKYYMENTNGVLNTMNYFTYGGDVQTMVGQIGPEACIYGYQGSQGGNPVSFGSQNDGTILTSTMSGQTQSWAGNGTNIASAANYVISRTRTGDPAFVLVCAGDGAHSKNVPANVLDATAKIEAATDRTVTYLTPTELMKAWEKWDAMPDEEMVDDTDAAITYNGTWGTWDNDSTGMLYNNTAHWSSGAVSLEYTFTGSGIQWITKTETSGAGAGNIYIDDELVGTVTNLGEATAVQQVVFEITGLSMEEHTLRFESTSAGMSLDAFKVFLKATDAPEPADPPRGTMMDDGDAAINYFGGWGTWPEGGSTEAGLYGGTLKYSYRSGNPGLEFSFTGTGFEWLIKKGPWTEFKANITINGGDPVEIHVKGDEVNDYYNVVVYSTNDLEYGTHTVRIVSGLNPATQGTADPNYSLSVDAFRILDDGTGPVEPESVMVDDDDAGIYYSNNWGVWNDSPLYGGGLHYSPKSENPYLEYTFTGTGIEWLTTISQWVGVSAIVTIDGEEPVTVDVDKNDAGELYQQTVYSVTDLAYGEHTIRIASALNPDSSNPADTHYSISIDAFRVFTGAAEPEPEPLPESYLVDEDDADIYYSANWEEWSERGDPGSTLIGGAIRYSLNMGTPPPYLEYTFTGTGIEWLTRLGGWKVYSALVSIDGEEAETVSVSGNEIGDQPEYVVFSVKDLPYGSHTIKISTMVNPDSANPALDPYYSIDIDAFRIFTGTSEPDSADTEALVTAVEAAELLSESDYTSDSWSGFVAALTAAQTVLADENAEQADVDVALSDLSAAQALLVAKADTAALAAKISAAAALVQSDYTSDSWSGFAAALTAAQTVLADENAEQADVDSALSDLSTAMGNLVIYNVYTPPVPPAPIEEEEKKDEIAELIEQWVNPYHDITEDDWCFEAVRLVNALGIMGSTGSTSEGDTFNADLLIDRAAFVMTLYRLAGNPEVTGENVFTDVSSGIWYEDAVIWGHTTGVVTGTSATTFTPHRVINRTEMAALLYRYAKTTELNLAVSADVTLSGYADADKVPDWGQEAMLWAIANGLLLPNEQGLLDPNGSATRAETAVILAVMIPMLSK